MELNYNKITTNKSTGSTPYSKLFTEFYLIPIFLFDCGFILYDYRNYLN